MATTKKGGKSSKRTFVKRDYFAEVTDRVLAHLDSGQTIHDLGWDRFVGPFCNPLSGTKYRGINTLMLAMSGKPDNRFCTFGQADKKGWHVRKGEKSTPIFYYTLREVQSGETGEDGKAEVKKIPMLKSYAVFAFSQVEGAPEMEIPDHRSGDGWALDEAVRDRLEAFLGEVGARTEHGGDRAYFSVSQDFVQMPERQVFRSEAEYYATRLHEVAHWSGGPSRLNREFGTRAEIDLYSREELRAELASAFLCARFGIPSNIAAHSGYVEHYTELLRGDKREIFRAARDAEAAVRYLIELSPKERDFEAQEALELKGGDLRLDPASPEGSSEIAEPEVFDLDEMFGDDLMSYIAESESLAQESSAADRMRVSA